MNSLLIQFIRHPYRRPMCSQTKHKHMSVATCAQQIKQVFSIYKHSVGSHSLFLVVYNKTQAEQFLYCYTFKNKPSNVSVGLSVCWFQDNFSSVAYFPRFFHWNVALQWANIDSVEFSDLQIKCKKRRENKRKQFSYFNQQFVIIEHKRNKTQTI